MQSTHVRVATLHCPSVPEQPWSFTQSTQVCDATLHCPSVPEHPLSSTQSTHVDVAGLHWFEVPEPQPACVSGSHAAQRPANEPAAAQTVPGTSAAQRAFAEAAWSHGTQTLPSQSGAVALAQSASLRHSSHDPATQNCELPVPVHAAPVPQRQVRLPQLFARRGLHAPLAQAVHWSGEVETQAAVPPLSQQSWF